LETTGLNWGGVSFGIVEVAVVHIHEDGRVETESSLVNPENPCQWGARKKHGISSVETAEAEPWGSLWAARMHDIAKRHVHQNSI
jgi:DNA polymerase III epsilon subunit-like protein